MKSHISHSFTLLTLMLLAVGCAKSDKQPNAGEATLLPQLPASWVRPSSQEITAEEESVSPEAAEAVDTAFRVHGEALDNLNANAVPMDLMASYGFHSPDWTPWHLDGMIASFAVDVGGVFGALVGDGAPSVKVTWQKQSGAEGAKVAPRKSSVHFNAEMTAQDVADALEPALRAAVAKKSVRDPLALRRNLMAQGVKFLSLVRALSHVKKTPGWHIDGFQLGLFFSANGQVTPVIGLGGTISLLFDWSVPAGESNAYRATLSPQETRLEQNVGAFAQSILTLLPEAQAETSEIRKAGFAFQVFQIGLGMAVGGQIGIASAQASAVGRIIFKSDSAGAAADAPLLGERPMGPLSLITPVMAFNSDSEAAFPAKAISIQAKRFRKGLHRAVKIGNFFAKHIAAARSSRWKANEIELGFDTSLGGDLGLATVAGIGLIRIGLERVE